jgi:hypothetical protein
MTAAAACPDGSLSDDSLSDSSLSNSLFKLSTAPKIQKIILYILLKIDYLLRDVARPRTNSRDMNNICQIQWTRILRGDI